LQGHHAPQFVMRGEKIAASVSPSRIGRFQFNERDKIRARNFVLTSYPAKSNQKLRKPLRKKPRFSRPTTLSRQRRLLQLPLIRRPFGKTADRKIQRRRENQTDGNNRNRTINTEFSKSSEWAIPRALSLRYERESQI
jgi:hypothetical protein